ncbi:Ubiquitin-associated domain-containing protein 2 [Mactra antiquata]
MIPVQSSSGFRRAPVCKFLLGSAIGSSVLLNFPFKHQQSYFIYTNTEIFDKYQIWKIFTSKLAFLDLKDLFVCSVLIYYFRIFEKRFGSRKFCSYLLGTGVLATCIELLAVYLCKLWTIPLGVLPSGPLCLIYPLFVPFYCDVPRVPLSHIWGIPMTGKSISYILGLQAASGSPGSILVALCGIIAGVLWRLNIFKVQSIFRIPKLIGDIFGSSIGRVLDNVNTVQEDMSHLGATIEIQRQEAMEHLEQQIMMRSLQNNHQQPVQNNINGPGLFGFGNNNDVDGLRQRLNGEVNPPLEVSEDQVQRMVEMGFNQEQVRHALQMSNNDVSMATNFLLQQTL